jgi:hypothetical protein
LKPIHRFSDNGSELLEQQLEKIQPPPEMKSSGG